MQPHASTIGPAELVALERALLRTGARDVEVARLRELVRCGHRLTQDEAAFVRRAMADQAAAAARRRRRLGVGE